MEVTKLSSASPGFATTPTGRTCLTVLSDEDGVIHLRARLLESVRRNENGEPPIGLERADHNTIKSMNDTAVGADQAWQPSVTDTHPPSRDSDGARARTSLPRWTNARHSSRPLISGGNRERTHL
jgi:hypothetical protein